MQVFLKDLKIKQKNLKQCICQLYLNETQVSGKPCQSRTKQRARKWGSGTGAGAFLSYKICHKAHGLKPLVICL